MAYTVTENGSAYDKGVAAGEIAARLRGHDRHLAEIAGTLQDLSRGQGRLELHMQRLEDAAAADRETVLATAKALKDAEEVRWAPLTRLSLIAGIALAVIGVVAFILSRIH